MAVGMTAVDAPLLRATALSAGYPMAGGGWRSVLRGLDLALAPGELVALLGSNGSGKTALLRCLAGTLAPTGGSVELDGRDLAELKRSEVARRVAVLSQHQELPAGFRVAELVGMGRAPHATRLFGSSADDERAVGAALRAASAMELADRPVGELSGGERQRVLVAMALAQEPALLLLDEPTVHLDLAHQVGLLATLDRLRRQRRLSILATVHDLGLALLCPRVVVLDDGRLIGDGPPERVLSEALVRSVFGVTVEAVRTAAGRPRLVLSG